MPLESAAGAELHRCVQRLVDADLILLGDGEALLGCMSPPVPASGDPEELHRLLQLLEALVAEEALPAAEAAPLMLAVSRALPESLAS